MTFTKVAPAGIGTEPGNSILIGDSLLHSTGIDIGSNTGIGVTIRKHGDATFTGIITASAFFGDGSGLEGVSSSGIGTPLSDDDTSDLNKIYYVNQELSIGSTVTVNHPDSAVASYTHYQDLVVTDDADFIVADGDTFIPDVLGIRTSTSTASAATGGRIRAGTITNAGANGAPNFPNGLTGTAGTFTGNLNVGGVLTYEDVTNVDSVGVITARSGIRIGATGANTLITGTATGIGIGTDNPSANYRVTIKSSTSPHSALLLDTSESNYNTNLYFAKQATNKWIIGNKASDDSFRFVSGSDERLLIDSNGNVTKPTSFHILVNRNGDQTGYTATGTTGAIIWNRVITSQSSPNAANHFNTSTGIFTAPVTGYYYFQATVHANFTVQESWLIINGSRQNYSNVQPTRTGTSPASIVITYKLTAGDEVGLKWYENGGNNRTIQANDLITWWRIVLLG